MRGNQKLNTTNIYNGESNDLLKPGLCYYQCVSIDPGVKNFALRISRRWVDKNNNIKKIDIIVFETFSFDEKDNNDLVIYHDITKILHDYVDYYKNCCVILIEKQILKELYFRIMQHVISYFITYSIGYKTSFLIKQIDPKDKLKILDVPKLKRPQLKKWLTTYAIELSKKRDDSGSLLAFDSIKKKDDLADTICQEEAYFKQLGLPYTKLNVTW